MGRPGLTRHRKFKRLARAIDDEARGFGELLARGALETLWDAVYESGDEYLGDAHDVEALAGWNGRAGLLTAALLGAGGGEGHSGFIEEVTDAPGRFKVHDLWDHAPDYVRKRRQRENERKANGAKLRSESGQGPGGGSPPSGQSPDGDRSETGQCPPNGSTRAPARTPAPAPAQAPAPARTPARKRAGGKILGPLGTVFVASVSSGLGHSLAPLSSDEEATSLEAAIESHGGAQAARDYIAATCRARGTEFDPQSVKLLLDMLCDPLPRGARA